MTEHRTQPTADAANSVNRIVCLDAVRGLDMFWIMGGVAYGFKEVYLPGVLPRIAVAYFFAALIFCFCRTRAMILVCVALLVGYWALLTFVPIRMMPVPAL